MDIKEIEKELTEFHIISLYYHSCSPGICYTDEFAKKNRKAAIFEYQNDPIFHRRVTHLVSKTMAIIENNIEYHTIN